MAKYKQRDMIHVISPHINDAILSIGGTIIKFVKSNTDVCVHYIFSGRGVPHIEGGVDEIRRMEISDSSKAGYKIQMHDFEIGLRDKGFSRELSALTDIEKKMISTINKERDIAIFPLGLADPDHQFIREIGISMFYKGFNIVFYEDIPDATQYDFAILYPLAFRKGFEPEPISVDMEEKISLINNYRNQIDVEVIKDLKNYAYNVGDNKFYERFWRPRGSIAMFACLS